MQTTRLSSKARNNLPKAKREAHQRAPSVDFAPEDTGDSVLLRRLQAGPATQLDEVVGCLGIQGHTRTIEQMDVAVGCELRNRQKRGRY